MKLHKLASYAVLTGAVVFSLCGCTSSSSGKKVVPHSHSGQMFRTEFGTVVSVREVVIEGSADSGVGQWGGAMIGGATGAAAVSSGGMGSAVAGSVAAVGGMIAGRQVEKAVTKADGYEITVQLEDGSQVLVVQEMDKGEFYDGDKVRVMVGTNTTEVMH